MSVIAFQKHILCVLFDHKYFVERVFSKDTRKLGCERCNKKWAMNDRVRVVVPWNSEFDEFYKDQTNVSN